MRVLRTQITSRDRYRIDRTCRVVRDGPHGYYIRVRLHWHGPA